MAKIGITPFQKSSNEYTHLWQKQKKVCNDQHYIICEFINQVIYVYCVQVNGMSISKCGGKWLFVEMWILKDFGQFSGELYGDATTCCKSGDFRADQGSPSGSRGAWFKDLNHNSDFWKISGKSTFDTVSSIPELKSLIVESRR